MCKPTAIVAVELHLFLTRSSTNESAARWALDQSQRGIGGKLADRGWVARVPVLLPCRGQARNLTETPENLTQFLNIRAPARVTFYFIIEFRQFYSPFISLYLKEETFPFRPHSLSKVGLNKSSSLLLRKILSLNTDVQCAAFKAFYNRQPKKFLACAFVRVFHYSV